MIAVSGGQDSLCLAHLLQTLQSKHHWQLAIAHCDHRWRSDSSDNARHVAKVAEILGLPFYCRTAADPPASEEKARQWRYQMLTEIAAEIGASIITTGHTLTDRAETVLFNFLRGAGLEGMQSLTWERPLSEHIKLVRPLLGISRAQTLAYCHFYQLPIWVDSTNSDNRYKRNRLRNEVFPYLKQHFNPQLEATLVHTAEIVTEDVKFWQAYIDSLWQKHQLDAHLPQIDRTVLQSYPRSVQRRMIRKFLQIYIPQQLEFDHIEKVVKLIDSPNRSQCDPLPGKAIVVVEHPWLHLQFAKISPEVN
ncbi:MAG: tRNA lysidine(34) synthetase TilS [Pseudanabaenaceae cyanobacterium SKYGB_i_bin29]|nr:tRNA lysidine(34) synthetase TilS [Pseudanabaenaceae cyanobacterium SKYG29]MDW8421221.1 tRNA lysidine(34) synthetase TilS [Pseudanabaenaceae cyanobacterium SKYGB_i_bin29]